MLVLGMSPSTLGDQILTERAPTKVAEAVERIVGSALQEIDLSLPSALAGELEQVRAYVSAFQAAVTRILDAVSTARPDLIFFDEAHRVVGVADIKKAGSEAGLTAPWFQAVLEQQSMSSPFSEWVALFGAGRGTGVAIVEHLRSTLDLAEYIEHPRNRALPLWQLTNADVVRFSRSVVDELARTDTPLDRVASVFGVTVTDLATVFGVSRQALEQWRRRGAPGDRQEKLAALGEVADLLSTRVKPDRIPAVVRRQVPAYGGRSILQALAAGDEQLVLDELRTAFDWSAAA
jgi:hypothetical protein